MTLQQIPLTKHNSHLFVSQQEFAEQELITQLQTVLCKNNRCLQCTTCKQIVQKTHPWIFWLKPETVYTADQIDEVLKAVQLTLTSTEKRFFVFTKAQSLTSVCCNRLLKTIEEPLPGYHFVFITNRPDELLPTLTSRCLIQTFITELQKNEYAEFVEPLISLSFQKPLQFIKMIDQKGIKETDTKEIIDLLFQHFYTKLKTAITKDELLSLFYLDLLSILKTSMNQPPMPGSTKIFWKHIFLQFHYTYTCLKKQYPTLQLS